MPDDGEMSEHSLYPFWQSAAYQFTSQIWRRFAIISQRSWTPIEEAEQPPGRQSRSIFAGLVSMRHCDCGGYGDDISLAAYPDGGAILSYKNLFSAGRGGAVGPGTDRVEAFQRRRASSESSERSISIAMISLGRLPS